MLDVFRLFRNCLKKLLRRLPQPFYHFNTSFSIFLQSPGPSGPRPGKAMQSKTMHPRNRDVLKSSKKVAVARSAATFFYDIKTFRFCPKAAGPRPPGLAKKVRWRLPQQWFLGFHFFFFKKLHALASPAWQSKAMQSKAMQLRNRDVSRSSQKGAVVLAAATFLYNFRLGFKLKRC